MSPMTPTDKANLTERDAEHIELIHMLKVSLENTRKLLEMWDREVGRDEPTSVGCTLHEWQRILKNNKEAFRCHLCGLIEEA